MKKVVLMFCLIFVLVSCDNNNISENEVVFNKLIIDKFDINKIPKPFLDDEKLDLVVDQYDYTTGEAPYGTKLLNKIDENLLKLYINDINFINGNYISIELTKEGMTYFSAIDKDEEFTNVIRINKGNDKVIQCSSTCPGYNGIVVGSDGKGIPHLQFGVHEGTMLERTVLFNKIAADLSFSNKVINLNELSDKINKNINYFNNKSDINEGELAILHIDSDDILDLAIKLDEKEFIDKIVKKYNEIVDIQNKSISISNKELIKIFKLTKEGTKGLRHNMDDDTYLFQILYNIKQSYYYGKVYFVLDGYTKGHEDLEKQYIDTAKYFNDKGIGYFPEDGLNSLEGSIRYAESISVNQSTNIRDSIAEGADSNIRMRH